MNFLNFLSECNFNQTKNPENRSGQTAFNTLAQVRPELATKVAHSEVDPYYDSDKLTAFFDYLGTVW